MSPRGPSDELWAVVTDPTRKQLLDALLAHGRATGTTLAAELPLTRQGVAKHLAALHAAGLVSPQRLGRETRYRLTPAPLETAMSWMAAVGGRWDERLAALERYLSSRGG